jgi:hypothetical protein
MKFPTAPFLCSLYQVTRELAPGTWEAEECNVVGRTVVSCVVVVVVSCFDFDN